MSSSFCCRGTIRLFTYLVSRVAWSLAECNQGSRDYVISKCFITFFTFALDSSIEIIISYSYSFSYTFRFSFMRESSSSSSISSLVLSKCSGVKVCLRNSFVELKDQLQMIHSLLLLISISLEKKRTFKIKKNVFTAS